PVRTPGGRYVAFESYASNLVPGDTNGFEDIFGRDLVLGTTERVDVTDTGGQSNSASFEASISDDGRYVAFSSFASNLVPSDGNGSCDVFVRDRLLGTTTRVSVASSGAEGLPGSDGSGSQDDYISGDGSAVAFLSEAPNL